MFSLFIMMTFSLTLHNDDPYCCMTANKSMIIKYWSLLWHLGLFVVWNAPEAFDPTIFCGLFFQCHEHVAEEGCSTNHHHQLLPWDKACPARCHTVPQCRNCCDFSPLVCPQGRSVGSCTANEGSLWHVHLTDLLWHLSTSLVHFSRYTNPDFPLGFVNPALSCICCSSSESD